MKSFLLYSFFFFCFVIKAQNPFVYFRTTLQNENYQASQKILDSCSFAKYQQDSVLFYKGLLTLKKGNLKGARTICNNLKDTYPAFAEVHYLSAMIYFVDQNYGNSISEFGLVIKKDPTHIRALFNRALAFGMLEDYSSAIEDLSTCISLNPTYGFAYFSRAYWHEFTNKFNEAKSDYEKSIQLDPKNYDAYFGLAYIYRNQKDNLKACETIGRAISVGSQIAEELKGNFCR